MTNAQTVENLTQKLFLFEGEGNSGKSTLTEILQAIIGEKNCTELRTEHLGTRFEMYRFLHRSLLVGSDVDHDFLLTEGAAELKKLTGGDLISAEKKRGNEAFEFRGDFNILVTSNSKLVLRLSSDAAAWKRRLVLNDFPASGRDASQNKPEYAKQLINREGSGILNWAVKGAANLLADFKQGRSFTLTADQEKRVLDRINESDSLCTFLREARPEELYPKDRSLTPRNVASESSQELFLVRVRSGGRETEENLISHLRGVRKVREMHRCEVGEKRARPTRRTARMPFAYGRRNF
jgi:phage/plasmid-associated DNA primase